MVSFKDLKTLLEIIIDWENKLTDFYDVAEIALREKESKKILAFLRENHVTNLKIIKDINLEEYGKDEWIKYAPDYRVKDLIPIGKIKRDSSPKEIFKNILEYEEKIKAFYFSISEKIISREAKELFDSLVKLKDKQVFILKSFLEI